MSLVTTKELMLDAQKNHYAIGAFNAENMEMVQAIIAAAEELRAPVIVQTTPGTLKYASPAMFHAMVAAAASEASVPVVMHLDHGSSYELAMQAFRAGYTSVMIDGSHHVFEENIEITKSVVRACHAAGIPVEAELGKVGGKEDDLDGGNGNGNNGIGAITAEGTRNRIFNNLFVDCNEAYFNTLQYKEIETADDGTLYPDTIINSSGVEVANTINGAKVADLKKQMEKYLPVYGKQFPELYNYFYEHPNMSKTNEFKNNMIINISIPLSNFNGTQNEEGFRGSQMLTAASGNYVSTSDPGFVSYDNGNLELSSSATSLVEGLPKFEMSSFGIQ